MKSMIPSLFGIKVAEYLQRHDARMTEFASLRTRRREQITLRALDATGEAEGLRGSCAT